MEKSELTEENIIQHNILHTPYYKYKTHLTEEENKELKSAISFAKRMNEYTESCINRYVEVIKKDILKNVMHNIL